MNSLFRTLLSRGELEVEEVVVAWLCFYITVFLSTNRLPNHPTQFYNYGRTTFLWWRVLIALLLPSNPFESNDFPLFSIGDMLLYFLAIFLPPVSVFIKRGCGAE